MVICPHTCDVLVGLELFTTASIDVDEANNFRWDFFSARIFLTSSENHVQIYLALATITFQNDCLLEIHSRAFGFFSLVRTLVLSPPETKLAVP